MFSHGNSDYPLCVIPCRNGNIYTAAQQAGYTGDTYKVHKMLDGRPGVYDAYVAGVKDGLFWKEFKPTVEDWRDLRRYIMRAIRTYQTRQARETFPASEACENVLMSVLLDMWDIEDRNSV